MSKKTLLWLSAAGVVVLILTVFLVLKGPGKGRGYGTIDPARAQTVKLASIFADTKSLEGKTVIVEGTAVQVCQTSGCWITMSDGANQLFVQFYDFTVKFRPGSRVRVQGQVRIQNNAPYLVGQGVQVVK